MNELSPGLIERLRALAFQCWDTPGEIGVKPDARVLWTNGLPRVQVWLQLESPFDLISNREQARSLYFMVGLLDVDQSARVIHKSGEVWVEGWAALPPDGLADRPQRLADIVGSIPRQQVMPSSIIPV